MKKNATTIPELQDEKKSFNLGEVVRMRTGDEKPRFIGKEREEMEAYVKQQYPDSPELLNHFIRDYEVKTGQEVRDIIIYGMLKDVLFTLDRAFNANKEAILDNMSIAKIRDRQFRASLKYDINPKNNK